LSIATNANNGPSELNQIKRKINFTKANKVCYSSISQGNNAEARGGVIMKAIKTSRRAYIESLAESFKKSGEYQDMINDGQLYHLASWLEGRETEFKITPAELHSAL
jgi:maltooligosyltrehalose synthase